MRVFTTFIAIKIRNRVYPKALVNALLKVKENFCDFGNFQEKGFFFKDVESYARRFLKPVALIKPYLSCFRDLRKYQKKRTR